MSTPQDVCEAIQDVVGAVSGVRVAPDAPPEQSAIGGVAAYVYPRTVRYVESTDGVAEGQYTLHLAVITPRRHLRTDYARINEIGHTIAMALLNSRTLSGTVLQIAELRGEFGALEWGGQAGEGWLFEIDVLASGTI